jgi:ketosteroid isomerase-like protein
MRKFAYILCFSLFALTGAVAQFNRGTDEDKESLRAIKSLYENAVNKNEIAPLADYIGDPFSAVMVTGEEVGSFDELRTYWKKIQELVGRDGTYKVEVIPDDTHFTGQIGLAKGSTKDTVTLGDGKVLEFTSKWSAVVEKSGDTWKVLHLQATMDPINNIFAHHLNSGIKWLYALGGAVIAFIVGFVIGRRRKSAAS